MITKLTSLLLAAILTITSAAATYSVDWWTVDGGGGSSTGGGITIDGTVGQPDASATTLSGGGFSVDGGFWGFDTSTSPPWGGRIYLPAVLQRPCSVNPVESEPNNSLAEANRMCLDIPITGTHDGAAGTGDLYYVLTHSTAGARITLDTEDNSGVQLLVYEMDGHNLVQLVQDAVAPFEIVLESTKMQAYYIYAYSDGGANNSASYSLYVLSGAGGLASEEPERGVDVPTPPPPPFSQP